ncbi:hypothetical protein OYE22_31090 [Streptomyces sp. 71268]|uniref:hypothetical protein n=1 Tax=Streptomyces sp. 71268 TaxID=3002640 RepID=UPI0023F7AA88|nr:hypothetical protein [Streptomyces sp. 71268]WEV29136.1 hypothetical protein OYE22_31090 [Streptomyces sp. 71268]
MPAPSITITAEPSGSVVARGASDDLSAMLLKHAGFQQIQDWYGRRHRLPTTTPPTDRAAIASHAAQMLRAARYDVNLAPTLDTTRLNTPANPLGPYTAGAEILRITDRIRAAESGPELQQAVDHLLHPEHGAVERVREALEAVYEQISDLDDAAYVLADQFGQAAEFVGMAQPELAGYQDELHGVGAAQQFAPDTRAPSAQLPGSRSAALATSPAAGKANVASPRSTEAPRIGPSAPPAPPSRAR